MQTLFHIILSDGQKMLLMQRRSKYRTSIKTRKSGEDGQRLLSEESYLNDAADLIDALKRGDTVHV